MSRRIVAIALAALVVLGVAPAGPTVAPAGALDPPVECAPTLPGPRATVQLAYMVLLGRCPDAAGAASWETSLREGMATETFARRITATPEARGVIVAEAYLTILERSPSAADRAFWSDWLRPQRRHRHDQLLAELAAAPELWGQAGGDARAWVDLLYLRVMGRDASTADRTYWVQRLEGSDRRTVARTLVRLAEPLGAEVVRAWRTILDAAPTAAQRAWEVARLRGDGDRLGLSARLVGSEAFATRAQARAVVVPGRYVAMGDSFAIGEGNQPWIDVLTEWPEPGEPEVWRCGYAVSAYPEVARTTSEQVPSDMDVPACTGATLLDLYPYVEDGTYPEEGPFGTNPTKSGGPSATGGRMEDGPIEGTDEFTIAGQIDAIADGPAPTLVTLTIGGNDVGFTSIVQSCLQVRIQGQGQHSPYYSAEECDAWLDELAPAAIEELRTGKGDVTHPDGDGYQCPGPCSLTSALTDVREAAPEARVLVVGYPPLMPPVDAGCKGVVRIDGRLTEGVEWYVAPADVRRGREVIADLNAALREAAEATGATYVDPGPRFAGHEVCSPAPWIHGVELDADIFPMYSTFHPNPRGGVAVAAAVTEALEA